MTAVRTPAELPFDLEHVLHVLRMEGLAARRWSSGPNDEFGAHEHAQHKVLYCLSGTITFSIVPGGESFALSPGDRLDLPPGAVHTAVVGPGGCECIEAYRQATFRCV